MSRMDDLINRLETQGYKARIVRIERLADLHRMIENFRSKGLLNERLNELYFSGFWAGPPPDFPDARSLIIVTHRDPEMRFTFQYNGKTIQGTVPPTYLHGQKKRAQALSALAGLLKPWGHRVRSAFVPTKLLAVCSGLAGYGRNNITYVEGMGSFHRPDAFCSDLACDDDAWREPVMMEQCAQCDTCIRGCPTGAILPDRFLLNVDRCITFWNEHPPDTKFPDWLEPAWHNCLVGCMICQRVCPANRDLLNRHVAGGSFSEEETRTLLRSVPVKDMNQDLQDKLRQSDLADIAELLPRNLRALLR